MASFSPVRIPLADLNITPIVDGQLLFVTDQDNGKNNIYIDTGNVRKQVGLFDWSVILHKPFETIGEGLVVTDGVLEGESRWNMITNKPFSTIGDGLTVDGSNELRASVSWSDIESKPFETIGSGLNVVNNALTANIQTWGTINDKPFNSIGVGLSVDVNGALSAIGGGTGVNWITEINNKPFESIGSGLQVVDGALETAITLSWSRITSKPFDVIGDGLAVRTIAGTDTKELITSYAWTDVNSKPFNTIGSGLTVVNDALRLDDIDWLGVDQKPFSTIGSGLTVDINNVLNADIQTVTAPTTGTASATTFCRQTLTINSGTNTEVNTEISGSKYMYNSTSLNASSEATCTFTSSAITNDSVIDVFVDKFGISPSNITVSVSDGVGTCVVTFPKTTDSSLIGTLNCRLYIR